MVLDATPTSSGSNASLSATSDDEEDDGSDSEASVSSGRTRGPKVGRRLHTGQLLQMVLQDAQTRLFFKAQAVIQSEIRHFVPTPDDLRWPDILLCAYLPLRIVLDSHLPYLSCGRVTY